MRIPIIVLAAALMSMTDIPGAAAAAPTRETVHANPQFDVGECTGDTIHAAFDVTRVVTTWTDDTGTPVRRIVHADIPGTLTNVNTGTTLQTIGVRVLQFDLISGVSTSTGTNVHVIVPGGGTLGIAAGRVVIDDQGDIVSSHGRMDGDLPAEVCAALTS
jgi:hypothetical protein